MTNPALSPITSIGQTDVMGHASLAAPALPTTQVNRPLDFTNMIVQGLHKVDHKLAQADAVANAFILDDSIPVHQVTFALEQARLSLELTLQVRSRLLDSYQQLMGMQL